MLAVALAGFLFTASCSSSSKQTTPQPTFTPAGGTYTSSQTVTVSDSVAGAAIYCTTDGSTPSTSGAQCSEPVTVSKSGSINAIAVASGYNASSMATATYTITATIAQPVFSPVSGSTVSSTQQVSISDATSGATIYYTTDGSNPTSSATRVQYSGAFTLSQTGSVTVNAAAAVSGTYSTVATATYTVTAAVTVAQPVILPATGSTISSTQQVGISDATSGATIYYTTDGSNPTSSTTRTQYAGAFTLSQTGSVTVNAAAVLSGTYSTVAAAAYTVTPAVTVAEPVISPATGSAINSAQQISISDATSGATIYYTTDGSNPTSSTTRTQYAGAFTLSQAGSVTVNAAAVLSGTYSTVATANYTVAQATLLSGTVISGSSPISGATVQLYAAGTTDYGIGSTTPVASASSPTSSTGAFTLNYVCPPAPGDQMYLVATNTGTGANPNTAIALMTALGTCSALPTTSVTVNEVTTVASAYALAGFASINSAGGITVGAPAPTTTCSTSTIGAIGNSTCNYPGLVNAFNTVTNLVNTGTGVAPSITPYYNSVSGGPVQYLNSSTVPQARIDTLANILAACVESSSSTSTNCNTLFGNAQSGSTNAGDTLQAALNIAQNPGNNVSTLYGLQPSTPAPYTPALAASSEPSDFTLALTFTGAGLGTGGNAQITNQSMAIGANGNIYVVASADTSASSMVAEFNNLGVPLTPATTYNATTKVISYGGYIAGVAGTDEPESIAIDEPGNLWIGGYENVAELATTPGWSVTWPSFSLGGDAPRSLAVDASGDLWMSIGEKKSFFEIESNGTLLPSYTGTASFGMCDFTFDFNGNLWADDCGENGIVYLINPSTGAIQATYKNTGGFIVGTDASGNVYDLNSDDNGYDVYNASKLTGTVNTFTPSTANCENNGECGNAFTIDGLGNIWAVTGGYPGTLDEVTSSGNVISPFNGYTGTSSAEASTILMAGSEYDAGSAIAADGSGNLWVLNSTTGEDGEAGAYSNVLVEFVGIAAPTITPTSVAVQNGTPGTRP